MIFKEKLIYKLITCFFIYLSIIIALVTYKVVGHYQLILLKIIAIFVALLFEFLLIWVWKVICLKKQDLNN